MAWRPTPEPDEERMAREEVLRLQTELNRLYLAGHPIAHFERRLDDLKGEMRGDRFEESLRRARELLSELDGYKRAVLASSALLLEVRSLTAKANLIGIDTVLAKVDVDRAEAMLQKGELEGAMALARPHLVRLRQTVWEYEVARDAVLLAQQTISRLWASGTDVSEHERTLGKARAEMRRRDYARALELAHEASPDRSAAETERQTASRLAASLRDLLGVAQGKGIDTATAEGALQEAESQLGRGMMGVAMRHAQRGIDELDPRIMAYDHVEELGKKALEVYSTIAATVGHGSGVEAELGRLKPLLAEGRAEEARSLATELIERLTAQRDVVASFCALRAPTVRYLAELRGSGGADVDRADELMRDGERLYASWDFNGALERLKSANDALLGALATPRGMDRLERAIARALGEASSESLRTELAGRLEEGRLVRERSGPKEAYRALEEVRSTLRASATGARGHAGTSLEEGEWTAGGLLDEGGQGALGGIGHASAAEERYEHEAMLEHEQAILGEIARMSADLQQIGADPGMLKEIGTDVRDLLRAGDAIGTDLLLMHARRLAAPNRFAFSHGVEMEMGLVYRDGSWVTGERVTRVISDLVEEGVKLLRRTIDEGKVPSYVSKRIVDVRLAQPSHPKRGKVVEVDYMVGGQLVTIDVLGRDAHGSGTTYILELVSPPCVYVEELLWWLHTLQRISCAILGVRHPDVLPISVGLNPAQPYSECISFGDHHHIKLPDEASRRAAFNMLRAHVPHLIALTVNSPIYKGDVPAIRWDGSHPIQLGSRTDPLSLRLRENIGQLGPIGGAYIPYLREGDGQDHFTSAVRKASAADARLVDIYPFTRFGTIEIRFFDAQLSVVDRVALAVIIQSLCAWAVRQMREGGEGPEVDPQVLLENRDRAIQKGMLLGFKKDKTLATAHPGFARLYQSEGEGGARSVQRIHDAVKRMLENIRPEMESIVPPGGLGGSLDTYLVMVHGGDKRVIPPPITPSQFLVYKTMMMNNDVPALVRYISSIVQKCGRNSRYNPIVEALGAPDLWSSEVRPSQAPGQGGLGVMGAGGPGGTDGGGAVPTTTGASPSGPDAAWSPKAGADGDAQLPPKARGTAIHLAGAPSPAGPPAGATTETPPEVQMAGAPLPPHAGLSTDAPGRRDGGTEHGGGMAGQPVMVGGAIVAQVEDIPVPTDARAGSAEHPLSCGSCHHEVEPGFLFCPRCGSQLTPSCPSCGNAATQSGLFCQHCGHPLGQGTTVQARGEQR